VNHRVAGDCACNQIREDPDQVRPAATLERERMTDNAHYTQLLEEERAILAATELVYGLIADSGVTEDRAKTIAESIEMVAAVIRIGNAVTQNADPMQQSLLAEWLVANGFAEETPGYGHVSADDLAHALVETFSITLPRRGKPTDA
jgi:hypothetical protein